MGINGAYGIRVGRSHDMLAINHDGWRFEPTSRLTEN